MLGGISLDHRIEEALMLNRKSEDRITKGRFNRVLAHLFVFSRPLCPEVMDGIEELSSFSFVARKGIKQESGNSSMIRDKSNGNRTYNHLVCYWTPNHLTKLDKRLSCVVSTYLHDVFDKMLLLCQVPVSEWIYTLWLPEYEGNPCSKQAQYLKIKWMKRHSNSQPP